MLLPRIFAPARAAGSIFRSSSSSTIPSVTALDVLRAANASLNSPVLTSVRHASHQSQGRANGAKQGPGKRLGAKKTGEEYVIPGNIIFRQRGTAWFPGENCAMGRDHCIYATESGYVKYYKDPLKHPKRQYIGVVFNRNDSLPYPANAARRRRLNMLAVTKEPEPEVEVLQSDLQVGDGTGSDTIVTATPRDAVPSQLVRRKGYAIREANWSIGRTAERANVKVDKFVPGDRFKAWRKKTARVARNAEKRSLRGQTSKKSSRRKR